MSKSASDLSVEPVRIYTDDACKGNPGPGGWGAAPQMDREARELFAGEPQTTNNRMELTAVILALGQAPRGNSRKRGRGCARASRRRRIVVLRPTSNATAPRPILRRALAASPRSPTARTADCAERRARWCGPGAASAAIPGTQS